MLNKKILEIQGLCFVIHRDSCVDPTEEDFLARFWWIHGEMQKQKLETVFDQTVLDDIIQRSKKIQIEKLYLEFKN